MGMGKDAIARSSFSLTRHENAHREHLHHQHNRFHNRQAAPVAPPSETVVEIVQTVVQQIEVDPNGNTIAVQTFLATAGLLPTAILPESSVPAGPTTPAALPPSPSNPIAGSAPVSIGSVVPQPESPSVGSLLSSQGATVPTTSIPSILPTGLAPLLTNSNGTSLISSQTSASIAFSNSTISSSSLTYSTSSSSSSGSTTSFSSLIPSTTSFSASSTSTSSTAVAGVIGGGTAVAPAGASATSAAGSDTGSSSGSSPSTPVVVGGVVGGVAGFAVILLFLLFIVRWRKRSRAMLPLGSGSGAAGGGGADTTTGGGGPQPSGGMAERSLPFAVPAAFASLTGYKRSSQKTETDRTVSSTAGSERGFYRVSGRKLPSVLQSGGDGYGGSIDETNTLHESSFYRDSQGFYGGPGSPSLSVAGASIQRDSGVPMMRASPARTPVTAQGPFSGSPRPAPPVLRPDVLGRSHPSQDGSHASKFTEEV